MIGKQLPKIEDIADIIRHEGVFIGIYLVKLPTSGLERSRFAADAIACVQQTTSEIREDSRVGA